MNQETKLFNRKACCHVRFSSRAKRAADSGRKEKCSILTITTQIYYYKVHVHFRSQVMQHLVLSSVDVNTLQYHSPKIFSYITHVSYFMMIIFNLPLCDCPMAFSSMLPRAAISYNISFLLVLACFMALRKRNKCSSAAYCDSTKPK